MTNEALCLAFQAGDRQAAEQLYLANYSFIRSIALAYARHYSGLWIDADDFTQEFCAVVAGSTAADIQGINVVLLHLGNGFLDVGQQRILIRLHGGFLACAGIEVTVSALACTERNVNINA